ncbi:hypothetical protein P3342_006541 [Pyrenophora teres f. teres]|uniref:Uncharacterized protein n=2 Tax=Pyrenophora teres f. teres TaxID=97479 RepID=E3RHJ3_PYRTT|nr:hypothetical protein PTT_07395 [Pyrenophora teres f. teres 0-1]KAE8833298.1 hypothetical protein HRS9139_05117 [Pyrenophora teres f. teres]KAE8840932.1 hypothetical protein PTNB85_04331 [Pyrenophora teres f. teres]KAE8848930.1 hypothetical protein HRS9122_02946 [Pyrenophora teres f. teres]KAE8864429.1 hypothetical protein PTNB29_04393 [Pyrenophora teres f. teres]
MAPVDTAVSSRSNSLPIALFGGQVFLVAVLTARVLFTTWRAAKSQPPSTRTRSQDPARRRHAITFSIIALLSLLSVGSFAFLWRAISYVRWAEDNKHDIPCTLWGGSYGTDEARWYLGDWIADIDLVREFDAVGIMKPEGFLYTSQYLVGLIASAIFMGAEGRRRNLSNRTIASFVLLSSIGSLGYALSLFFITILYTPLTIHHNDTPLHDALFTPHAWVYDMGIVASLLTLNLFPQLVSEFGDKSMLRLGYLAMPIAFAFAPQLVPYALGRQHTSKASAHRSYAKVFHALSLASILVFWRVLSTLVYVNRPSQRSHVWDVFTNSIGKSDSTSANRLLTSIGNAGQALKNISTHPAISVTSLDVLFTSISLLTWTFTRDLDVHAILESSVLSFLVPTHEKHVTFQEGLTRLMEHADEPSSSLASTTPRKRGRPSKKAAANGASTATHSAPTTAALRRSTRGKAHSVDLDADAGSFAGDPDATYQPSEETKRAVEEMEADGSSPDSDLVSAGESTALALFLALFGGLGQLAAGSLGAEVTGPRD